MLYYFFLPVLAPFILVAKIIEFVVWDVLDTNLKERQEKKANLAGYWQGQAEGLSRKAREIERDARRRMEDLEARRKKELQAKEREISFLRSKLGM